MNRTTALALTTLLTSVLLPVTAGAQDLFWSSRARYRTDLGELPRAVAEDSTGRLLLSSAAGLATSSDGGDTWTRIEGAGGFGDLQFAPDGTIFAIRDKAVFRSRTGGRTWTLLPAKPGYWGFYVTLPLSSDTILTGTNGVGIERSTDGGSTFTSVWRAPYLQGEVECFVELPGGAILAGEKSYLLRSTDRGASFREQSGGLPALTIHALAYSPATGVVAGLDRGGLWRSLDGGLTWDRLHGIDSQSTVTWIGIASDGIVHLAAKERSPGYPLPKLYRSTDRAITFAPVMLDGRPAYASKWFLTSRGDLIGSVVDSADMTKSPLMRRAATGDWMQLGSDLHDAPVRALAVDPDRGLLLAGSTGGGIHRSTDGGATWSPSVSWPGTRSINAIAVTARGMLVATRDDGVHRSSDRGATWTPVSDGLPSAPVGAITVIGVDTLVVLSRGRLYGSTTLGATWLATPQPPSTLVAVAGRGDRLAALDDEGLVHWTDDGGLSWDLSHAAASHAPGALMVDVDGTIVCGGTGAVVLIDAEGAAEVRALPDATAVVTALARGPRSGAIVAAAGARAFVIRRSGGAVIEASRGLPNAVITSLSSSVEGVFAGLSRGGIRHLDETALGIPTTRGADVALGAYPSVVSNILTLHSSAPIDPASTIEIADVLGRTVLRHHIEAEHLEADRLQLRIDDLGDGIYWARIPGLTARAVRFIVHREASR